MKKILGVIPARYQSTRFPGKPLIDLMGKTMIQHVYERCTQANGLSTVLVATDDQRIFDCVTSFGGQVCMTSPQHPSGTDRLLEVASQYPDFDAFINIQGDEPLIDPRQIDQLCSLLFQHDGAFVGTLYKKLDLQNELENPNVIKVVVRPDGQAIYFSRSPIPYLRAQKDLTGWHAKHGFFKHIGMYAYSKAAIYQIGEMGRGLLEQAESLEQLRWMEAGMPIWLGRTEIETKGVDVPEDVAEVLALMKKMEA